MAQKEKVRLENEIREIELRIEQEAKVSFSNFTEIRNNVQVDKLQDSIFPIWRLYSTLKQEDSNSVASALEATG